MDDDLLEDTPSVPSSIPTVTSYPRPTTHLKLALPKFSGKIVDWHRFWSVYEGRMERETALSDLEKVGCLEDAMQSVEAKDIVRQAAQSRSYTKVVEVLKREFDQPRLIFNRHLARMLAMKPVKDDNKSLSEFLRTIEGHVEGLQATEGFTAEQLVCGILFPLMTGQSKQEWKTHIASTVFPPTLEQLTDFLLKRKDATRDDRPVEDMHLNNPNSKLYQQPKSKPLPKERKQSGRVFHTQESSLPACSYCQQGHYTYKCPSLTGQSVEQRNESVKQKRLCYNCLSANHMVGMCPSRKSCKECGRKHHCLLHQPALSKAASPAPATTNQQTPTNVRQVTDVAPVLQALNNSPGSVLLQTALMDVSTEWKETRTRVVLDSGAAMSLITSKLANTLKARRQKSNIYIAGLGGSTPSNSIVTVTLTSSVNPTAPPLYIQAHVVHHICNGHRAQNLDAVCQLDFLQGKTLADPYFGKAGKVDLLIGIKYSNRCRRHMRVEDAPDRDLVAVETIFGWVIGGDTQMNEELHEEEASHPCLHANYEEATTNDLLKRFFDQEEVPNHEEPALAGEDQQVIDNFHSTTTRLKDGRYEVRLPRKASTLPLGESRPLAERHYLWNERSVRRNGTLQAYMTQLRDYAIQDHAEKVPEEDLAKPCHQTFYLPMHRVEKASSTTTKLRVVCDASAKTTSGQSLNDILLSGPSLYPRLTTILQRFRLFDIAYSADISRMIREVSLHFDDRDLHRYLVRGDGRELEDWRMTRVTFGVTSSPFLATATLRRIAQDYSQEHPTAALVSTNFYVDDFLHGSATLQDAQKVRQDINSLLSHGQMRLRKWRTNSPELLASIPEDLRETEPLCISTAANSGCPKALGVHWNTTTDTLFVATLPPIMAEPTKRIIASQAAKMFDVLGWFAPIKVKAKHLLQLLWKSGISWDERIPPDLLSIWNRWNKELYVVSQFPIPRKLISSQEQVQQLQLHGFSDASQAAYGAVVYARYLHKDATVSITLITAKTRVAAVKGLSIPRLELCGAKLLAQLISTTATDIEVPASNLYGWCDSTAVLGWLRNPPSKVSVFVNNRVTATTDLLPASRWRYVATKYNPADLAS